MASEPDGGPRAGGGPAALTGVVAVLVTLILVAGWQLLGPGRPRGADTRQAATVDETGARAVPPGWRWESYGGVEVRVPSNWAYGISDTPLCGDPQVDGEVGRPGPVRAILCTGSVPPERRGHHVWLGSAVERRDDPRGPGSFQLGGGWVRDVIELSGVRIDLQTRDPGIRERVLASIRAAPVDVNRCPADHPISDPRWVRPERGTPWEARVTGVSTCRYDGTSGLHGSRRLDGAAAQRVLDAIEAAPSGGSDERSATDPAGVLAGGTVLRFDTADGVREVFVRYDFGQLHGFDNGHAVRRLTRPALTFMSGPLVVNAGPGSTMELLPRG